VAGGSLGGVDIVPVCQTTRLDPIPMLREAA
jgi:hypothetical protein